MLTADEPVRKLLTLTAALSDVRLMVAALIVPELETLPLALAEVFVTEKMVPVELPATLTPLALVSMIETAPVELALRAPAFVVVTVMPLEPALITRVGLARSAAVTLLLDASAVNVIELPALRVEPRLITPPVA